MLVKFWFVFLLKCTEMKTGELIQFLKPDLAENGSLNCENVFNHQEYILNVMQLCF